MRVALRFAFGTVVGINASCSTSWSVYRPLLDWLAALKLVQRFEAWVGGLPAYAVVLIAVPYGVVEPVKFLALIISPMAMSAPARSCSCWRIW